MNPIILILLILVPILSGAALFALPRKLTRAGEMLFVLAALANLGFAIATCRERLALTLPWGAWWFEFSLKLTHYGAFTITALAALGFLIALYTGTFLRGKPIAFNFFAYFLLTIGFVNGAVLANNLLVMLFFWEGLAILLFAMIALGHKGAYKTAVKAFVISGVADLCMVFGIATTIYMSGTATISDLHVPINTAMGSAAFVLMLIGAIAKGGSMPFHSWIPDAAVNAPLPFMAIIPGAMEKLLGIYLVTRISLDMFALDASSWLSTLMMIIGATTILLAVLMALIQKDYKRLLSFHAISQMGYMILGIGTMVPIGIVGGIFHMINNALYKSCLFLTGGAVEKQTGTTDLRKLGGLARRMPVTFIGFAIAALSISGVPPFNGFFSKELVYDGALERGTIFYLAAVIGSFLTAASFLKLGHAAFLGPRAKEHDNVSEAPATMTVPIIIIAIVCIIFGLYNALPVNQWIQPVLGEARLAGASFGGLHVNPLLGGISVAVLIAALLNHIYGVHKTGKGLGAVDHIYYAPVAHKMYDTAEAGRFDPYNGGMGIVNVIARIAWVVDRGVDYIYDTVAVRATQGLSGLISMAHNGSHARYIIWALAGLVIVVVYLVR